MAFSLIHSSNLIDKNALHGSKICPFYCFYFSLIDFSLSCLSIYFRGCNKSTIQEIMKTLDFMSYSFECPVLVLDVNHKSEIAPLTRKQHLLILYHAHV